MVVFIWLIKLNGAWIGAFCNKAIIADEVYIFL